jgi:hypothetical protein
LPDTVFVQTNRHGLAIGAEQVHLADVVTEVGGCDARLRGADRWVLLATSKGLAVDLGREIQLDRLHRRGLGGAAGGERSDHGQNKHMNFHGSLLVKKSMGFV